VDNLRPPNSRPTVLVDPSARGVADPQPDFIGQPQPLGRERLLYALPLDPGPALLRPAAVLRSAGASYVADPSPELIGVPAIWVARFLTALPSEDTRGMGGP
jgi:hypothetical protein